MFISICVLAFSILAAIVFSGLVMHSAKRQADEYMRLGKMRYGDPCEKDD